MENTRSWNRRQSAQIGAGLSFALAAWLLVATGRWEWLLLVPVGALVGLVFGGAMARYPSLAGVGASLTDDLRRGAGLLVRWLEHPRLTMRFVRLLAPSVILFIAIWSAAYAFLPERMLAAGSDVRMMGNAEVGRTLWVEWQSIVVRNLPWVAAIAMVSLLVGYAYACTIPVVWTVFYAVILGTNSFAFPMPERMGPSFQVLGRAGPYELAAFLLAAAASYPLSRVSLPWRERREEVEVDWREAVLALVLSASGVLLAAWREAVMIVGL